MTGKLPCAEGAWRQRQHSESKGAGAGRENDFSAQEERDSEWLIGNAVRDRARRPRQAQAWQDRATEAGNGGDRMRW